MTDIAEITRRDREKIKEYVESSKFLTYTMLAERFGISKSYLSPGPLTVIFTGVLV